MTQPKHVTEEAYDQLCALLEQRRRMVKRHARERSRRCQGTLAEKLAERATQKAELDALNTRIDALNTRIDALMAEADCLVCGEDHQGNVPLACATGDGV